LENEAIGVREFIFVIALQKLNKFCVVESKREETYQEQSYSKNTLIFHIFIREENLISGVSCC